MFINFLLYLLGWVFLFETSKAISANLMFKISNTFVNGIENDIYNLVHNEMIRTKNSWSYRRNFDDKFMKETDDGIITIKSYSSPVVSYDIVGGQRGGYDYIKIRYPEVKLYWKYKLYYTPVWIPVYWGMGYNYYKIENLEFKFHFKPPQYRNGKLSDADLTLRSSTDYTNFAWIYHSGQGDHYGDKLNNWRHYNDVINSLTYSVRDRIESSWAYSNVEKTINRAIRDLPTMQNSGLIQSSDWQTMMDMEKLVNSYEMDFTTRLMYRYPHFWMDISMTPRGSYVTVDPYPPAYDVEFHLKDVKVSPIASVRETQKQALGNINAAGLKTYFFPEGEHKTITKVDNVGQEDISLSLSDTKKISLSEVAEDGKNNFYRKLSWEIRQAGIDEKSDFFAGHAVDYAADFSIYSLESRRNVYKNQTAYLVVTQVPCELRASLDDITPAIESSSTKDEVTRKIATFKEGVKQICDEQRVQSYWKVPKPKGMSFYGYGITLWKMQESSFSLDFHAKLRND